MDWSPSSLLCAGVVRQEQGRLMTDGQASGWEDGGQLSKLLRLQREEEHTRRKANHLATLLRRHPNAVTQHQWAVLDAQQRALSLKRVRLGRSLAWQGANHLVSLAVQSGASLIAFEDLRDLDTTGRGVFQNNRSSQSVRGVLYTCTEQAASRHGIEVVQVPARGTSAKCPCCDGPVSRPQGYHSAACTACGLTGNRDVVACVNIAKRALLGRNKMARPKGGVKRIRETLHAPVTVQTDTLLSRASRQPRRQKSTRSLVLPKPRIRRDRAGNRTQSKHPKRFPARVSLRGQVERTSLNVTGNLAKRELPGLLKDTVPDGVLIEV
ncbi:zinc ribbon domain-containing protein [Deinococcus ruber]|nr:zinc ribbon domain-containing protein [Deinococcus ruber]